MICNVYFRLWPKNVNTRNSKIGRRKRKIGRRKSKIGRRKSKIGGRQKWQKAKMAAGLSLDLNSNVDEEDKDLAEGA